VRWRYYWIQVLLDSGTTGFRYYWIQVLLDSGTTGFRYYWIQVLLDSGRASEWKFTGIYIGFAESWRQRLLSTTCVCVCLCVCVCVFVCVCVCVSSYKIFHVTQHHKIYNVLVTYFYCKYSMTTLINQLGTGF